MNMRSTLLRSTPAVLNGCQCPLGTTEYNGNGDYVKGEHFATCYTRADGEDRLCKACREICHPDDADEHPE